MKSIERRFKKIESRNLFWSSYTSFSKAIMGQCFSEQTVAYWFKKLVNQDDYAPEDKKSVLDYLKGLTNIRDDTIK